MRLFTWIPNKTARRSAPLMSEEVGILPSSKPAGSWVLCLLRMTEDRPITLLTSYDSNKWGRKQDYSKLKIRSSTCCSSWSKGEWVVVWCDQASPSCRGGYLMFSNKHCIVWDARKEQKKRERRKRLEMFVWRYLDIANDVQEIEMSIVKCSVGNHDLSKRLLRCWAPCSNKQASYQHALLSSNDDPVWLY